MNFDSTKYKIWTWKNPLVLHWILNPGLAFNELILGQRVPRITLIERNSKKSLAEKTFIPCPHCNTIHSALKWTPQNNTAFGNWFGLYCDKCKNTIPCLTNLTSLILLGVTFPIWIWFKKSWKRKWLSIQQEKFSKPLNLTPPVFNWVTQGLQWGFIMFVFMEVIFPLIDGEEYKLSKFLIGIAIWTIAGLLFGFVMKKVFSSQLSKTSQDKTQQAT
jgi:hypothetical protein